MQDEHSDDGQDAFRMRLRVGSDDLLFGPLRHCRNANERGRMFLTYAVLGYLASTGIQVGAQLLAVAQAGGLVAKLTHLTALAGTLGAPQARAATALRSEPAMPAITPPADGASEVASPRSGGARGPYDVSSLNVIANGDAVQC